MEICKFDMINFDFESDINNYRTITWATASRDYSVVYLTWPENKYPPKNNDFSSQDSYY
jgi:hypothetical protein